VLTPVASDRIMGRGWQGYLDAIDAVHELAGRDAPVEPGRH
jgi:hypothetical protein